MRQDSQASFPKEALSRAGTKSPKYAKGPGYVVKIVAVQLIKWETGTLPVLEASGGAAAKDKLSQVLRWENATTSSRNKGLP